MPYISKANRERLAMGLAPTEPGELNYIISTAIKKYLDTKGTSYHTFNDVIGVLECAKMELYRRIISPYEDKKLKENGDVYEYH